MNTPSSVRQDPSKTEWSIAVLASREAPNELMATINALKIACKNHTAFIDVLVNGNRELARSIARKIEEAHGKDAQQIVVRVWFFALGDKANTWNQFVHQIWPNGTLTFFVDGYVRVAPNALDLIQDGLSSSPEALAGTGVPSSGRSASRLRTEALREHNLHGNLFALRSSVMDELRSRSIRLPLGLYGYDALIGAMIAFGLNPSLHEWNPKLRILVSDGVTWTNNEKKWWRMSDLKTQFQRFQKLSLRALVVKALKDFFEEKRRPPELLPRTLAELVLSWAEHTPTGLYHPVWRAPFSVLALKKLRKPRDWALAEAPPELIFPGEG